MHAQWIEMDLDHDQHIAYIVDRDAGGKSITNDAEWVVEQVVASLRRRGCDKAGSWRIVYRDTGGRWDELVHDDGVFKAFRPGRMAVGVDPAGEGDYSAYRTFQPFSK